MVVIIDYGMGNLKSVYNALVKIGIESVISSDENVIKEGQAFILPGVGSFKDCMDNLIKLDLVRVLKEEVNKGKLLFGICLGMQVLFEKGFEGKECEGLGFLKGTVEIMDDINVKIPHIGWNNLEKNNEDEILNGLEENSFMYYVHSYKVNNYNNEDLVGYSSYGSMKVPGIFRKRNVIGAQFHPEKSGEDGLKILRNFKEMIKWL